jgi:hypothetical protein
MSPNKTAAIITIILFNLVPIIGVAFYHWSPFEMFWLFWMETLIISFFNAVRILFSQERSVASLDESVPLKYNVSSSFKYLLTRIAIFFFYSIFIITFIGFLSYKEKDPVHVVRTLAFQNLLFNLALLLIICTQLFYILRYFFINGAYVYAKRDQYTGIFDGRQIVIHVAVGSAFLFKEGTNPYAAVWIISVLCVAKTIFELLLVNNDPAINVSGTQ